MNKTTSIYLDLVRFLAALLVFNSHLVAERISGGIPYLNALYPLGSDSVMAFFVLSGFVIYHVASTKEKQFSDFFISRLARLYSVVFPAIILTVILDLIGRKLALPIYDGNWSQVTQPFIRCFMSFTFMHEIWFYTIRPFSNVPFWSIGYEFWYYLLFAFMFYTKGKKRVFLILLTSAFIGPKILVLFPIWLLGVLAYKISIQNKLKTIYGWVLFSFSIVGFALYFLLDGHGELLTFTESLFGSEFTNKLAQTKYLFSDYIVGLLVFANFIGFTAVSDAFSGILGFFERPIRYLASYTFILYLMHYPLLEFFAALTYKENTQSSNTYVLVIGTLFSIWALGPISEKQKSNYKKFFLKFAPWK